MAETKTPSLHELNLHLFAALLPETHGKPAEKSAKKGKAPTAEEQAALDALAAAAA